MNKSVIIHPTRSTGLEGNSLLRQVGGGKPWHGGPGGGTWRRPDGQGSRPETVERTLPQSATESPTGWRLRAVPATVSYSIGPALVCKFP